MMPTKRLAAARMIAARLFAAEEAVDLAVQRVAELNAALPEARLCANLSALVGRRAFGSSADTLCLIAKARDHLVMTHRRLRAAGDDVGLAAVDFGDSIKPPNAADRVVRPALKATS